MLSLLPFYQASLVLDLLFVHLHAYKMVMVKQVVVEKMLHQVMLVVLLQLRKMLMVLFDMDDVASMYPYSYLYYYQQSFDDVVVYDDMVTLMIDVQHVASLMFDVVVEQQLNLDQKTWLQQHLMALLYKMFEHQSLDLIVQVDMLA